MKQIVRRCMLCTYSIVALSGCGLAGPGSPFAAYQQCHSKLQEATNASSAFACFVDPAKTKLINQWTEQTEWLPRYKDFRQQTRGELNLYHESVSEDGKTADLHMWVGRERGAIRTLEVSMAKGFTGWKIAKESYSIQGTTVDPNAPQLELSLNYPGKTERAGELMVLGGGASKVGSCLLLIYHTFHEASIQIPADCAKLMQPGTYSFGEITYQPWTNDNRGLLLARFPAGRVKQAMNAVVGEMVITKAPQGYASGHFSLQIPDSGNAEKLSGSFKNVPAQ